MTPKLNQHRWLKHNFRSHMELGRWHYNVRILKQIISPVWYMPEDQKLRMRGSQTIVSESGIFGQMTVANAINEFEIGTIQI